MMAALLLGGTAISAEATAGGAISIQNNCPSGVTGTATFSVFVTDQAATSFATVTLDVPCGHTVAVSIPAANLVVGNRLLINETVLPAHAANLAQHRVQIGHILETAQTATFDNILASGALNVHLVCGPGVSGSGFFGYDVDFPAGTLLSSLDVPLGVACGATVDLLHTGPGADSFPVGAVVTVTEVEAPTGGNPATVSPVTLTAGDQTVTLTNAGTPVAAGNLSIQKICASGVTGTAVFDVKVTPFGEAAVDIPNVSVACGGNVVVPIPTAAKLVGAIVVITETTVPTGGVKATIPDVMLTADARIIRVNNAKATPAPTPSPTPSHSPTPTPAPTVVQLPSTGSGGSGSGDVLIALLAMSFVLVASGAGIGLIRRTR
jgi:hypothetical protein